MSSKKCHLTYALSTLVMGAALVLVGPVSAENFTTIDPSTQPHLKSWSNIIPNAAKRFVVLSDFNNEAVLDRETGLVWAQSPALTLFGWKDARFHCPNKNVGGRKGWRLPSFPELASLIDPSNLNPTMPTGHPFTNVQSAHYWSATALADDPTSAWLVDFSLGVGNGGKEVISGHAWCVRGPMNADTY
jgi:hypothetical protein